MPVFEYRGVNEKGKPVKGIIDADSPRAARAKLRKQNIFASDLTAETGPAQTGLLERRFRLRSLFETVNVMDVSVVARQLSTLTSAGMPLVAALQATLEQQPKQSLQKALTKVRERVNEGLSLADALREHPRIFPELFVDMVKSGEASGALDIVLVRLADYLEEHARNSAKLKAVLTYPALMLTVAGIIVFLIFTKAIPQLKGIFETMGKALPPLTRTLIAIGDFLSAWWWVLALGAVGAVIAVNRYGKTEKGRRHLDRIKLNFPITGELILKISVARFARTLSTLLASGIPILKALEIVEAVVANRVLADAIEDARGSIQEGASISGPLRASGVFPPILIHMVAIGEQSGQLEDMLGKVATAYDNEVATATMQLTSLLEPVIILLMAGIVVFIALAILQPIFQLNQLTTACAGFLAVA